MAAELYLKLGLLVSPRTVRKHWPWGRDDDRADFLNNLGPSYVKTAKEIYDEFNADTSSEEARQGHKVFWSRSFRR